MRRRIGIVLVVAFTALGSWQFFSGSWIYAKAALAKGLIADAWAETLASHVAIKPWPWADTYPVAKLDFPTKGRQVTVLTGASGATLAFGPGHLDGTPKPGRPGNSIIAGHRDTSFTLLGDLKSGDPVRLQLADGDWRAYKITGSAVVDSRVGWSPPQPSPGESMLTLVTCWPLDALAAGGPLRYLVFAEESGP